MGRAAENRAGAVFHEHEIRDIDRQGPALDEGVRRDEAGVEALLLGPLDRLFAGA